MTKKKDKKKGGGGGGGDYKYLWQRKKDQTTNVDGKQKMAALIRQANS